MAASGSASSEQSNTIPKGERRLVSSSKVYVAISPELAGEIYLPEHLASLDGLATVNAWEGPDAPPVEAVVEALDDGAEVLLTGWYTPSLIDVLAEWSPESSALRFVSHAGGTVRHIIPRSAIDRGLRISHANRGIAETVAEFTLAAMLVGSRRMFASVDHYRDGRPRVPHTEMRGVLDSTVGVVGASTVGRAVLTLLKGLGVNALVYDPFLSTEDAAALGARPCSLDELLAESDVVTVHAPLLEETKGMLGAAQFARMKDGALFVNCARGALIDPDALFGELQSGRLYAFLDVTDPNEPLPNDSPFFTLENCILTPHVAGMTSATWSRIGEETVDEIRSYLAGERVRNEVGADAWDRIA